MSQQSRRQARFRDMAGGLTSGDYNGNLIAAAEAVTGLDIGHVNEAEIRLLQSLLDSTLTDLNGLRAAYANRIGASDWSSVGELPAFALDFVTGRTSLPAFVDFSRSSAAWYWDSNQVLQKAASGVPRFDHDPSDGTALGILIEGSRTNNLTRSDEFDHSDWSDVGTPTVTADNTTSPDGTTNADKIQSDGSSDEGRSQAITVADDSNRDTVTVFLKQGTQAKARIKLALSGGTTTKSGEGDFDLSAGSTGTAGGDLDNIAITANKNGWYRCEAKITNNGTGNTTLTVSVLVGDAAADTGTIFAWRAQHEDDNHASSPIKTEGSTETRAADICKITDLSWFSNSVGTWITKGVRTTINGAFIIGASNENRPFLQHKISGKPSTFDGTTENKFASGTSKPFNFGLAYGSNQMTQAANGAVNTGLVFDGDFDATGLAIGVELSSNKGFINGHITSIKYYAERKSDSFLQSETS